MNEKLKIIAESCSYILATLVLLYLYLKISKESKTFRLAISIFAWVVLILMVISYVDRYLIKS